MKISGKQNDMFEGFQIGAHSVDGLWETLYGEFISVPETATPYKYYSDVVVCYSKGSTAFQYIAVH